MEEGKNIKCYEGLYQVSNLGRIKSLSRTVYQYNYMAKKDIKITFKEKIRKPRMSKDGYYIINLNKDGKMTTYRVHRLVGEQFVENKENKPYINHKDGNKLNNNVDNLEWCTAKENSIHGWKIGLMKPHKTR